MKNKVFLLLLIFLGISTYSEAQNILRTSEIEFEKVIIYGCGIEVAITSKNSEFNFGNCKVIDSIRVIGESNLFFNDYKWKLSDEQLFINIALSYVDIQKSYSIIFHNENSVVWHIYENNGNNEWANLIVPNCDGDNTHKFLTPERLMPLVHVPDEYLHR